MFIMIDGMVCNAVATQHLHLMNSLEKKRVVISKALDYGLSIVHARIRFFLSILHLANKLPIRKWQLRTEYDKATVKQKKLDIQKGFGISETRMI